MTADSTAPSPDQLRRIDALFDELLDCDPDTRDERLAAMCRDSPDLRPHLDRLLRAADEDSTRFDHGATLRSDLLAEAPSEQAAELPCAFGRYRLVEEIGRGGMGVVYRAERADGAFDQEVAIKLLRPGTHPDLERRFDQERRILAVLTHPHIARLLDGGVSVNGEPYLVVEMVHGERLDTYCRRKSPGLRDRVQMLIDICSALEFAHRNLIVHRDIKPANLLVEADGCVKLLDFGIAKLLDDAAGIEVELTQTRHKVMTLQYASPEQFRGDPVNVHSDIYQLGLLAYEVLSGARPYELDGALPTTAQEWITHRDPPPPSRATTGRALPADLDLIVMKAMRKEPERRYPSAAALREDLERYLEGRPIEARPNSWAYRSRRFVQRHTVPVVVAAVALILLLGSSVAFTNSLVKARKEAEEAAEAAQLEAGVASRAATETDAVLSFMVDLMQSTGTNRESYREQTVLDLLETGRTRISGALEDQPRARARILATLGELYRRSDLEISTTLIQEATEVARQQLESGDLGRVEVGLDLAGYLAAAARNAEFGGEYERALVLLEEAEALVAAHRGPDSREAGIMLENLSTPLLRLGRIDEGLDAARRAVEVLTHSAGATSHDRVRARRALAEALAGNGLIVEARQVATQVLADIRGSTEHGPLLVQSLASLAAIESQLGDHDAAQQLFGQAAEQLLESNGPNDLNRLILLGNRAHALAELGRAKEALTVVERGLHDAGPPEDASHLVVANLFSARGAAKQALGDHEAALMDLRRATSMFGTSYPDDHHLVIDLGIRRADSLLRLGRNDEAEVLYREAIQQLEASFGPDSVYLFDALFGMAEVAISRGETLPAEAMLERALELRHPGLSGENEKSERARERLEELRSGGQGSVAD